MINLIIMIIIIIIIIIIVIVIVLMVIVIVVAIAIVTGNSNSNTPTRMASCADSWPDLSSGVQPGVAAASSSEGLGERGAKGVPRELRGLNDLNIGRHEGSNM